MRRTQRGLLRLSKHLPQQSSVFSTALQVKKLYGKPKYSFERFVRERERRKTILKIWWEKNTNDRPHYSRLIKIPR